MPSGNSGLSGREISTSCVGLWIVRAIFRPSYPASFGGTCCSRSGGAHETIHELPGDPVQGAAVDPARARDLGLERRVPADRGAVGLGRQVDLGAVVTQGEAAEQGVREPALGVALD